MRDNDFKTSCHHMSTCALTGASAFFDAIPGSFMLINGPLPSLAPLHSSMPSPAVLC